MEHVQSYVKGIKATHEQLPWEETRKIVVGLHHAFLNRYRFFIPGAGDRQAERFGPRPGQFRVTVPYLRGWEPGLARARLAPTVGDFGREEVG